MRIILYTSIYILFTGFSAAAVAKGSVMATQLADFYLKSFVEIAKPLSKDHEAKKAKVCDTNITHIYLSPRSERAVVFNEIFAKSSYYQDQYQQAGNLLNPYAWHDWHLFCGTTSLSSFISA